MGRKKESAAAPIFERTLDATDEEAAAAAGPSDAEIGSLVELGTELATLDAGIAAAEVYAGMARSRRQELVRKIIPEKMVEAKSSFVGLDEVNPKTWLANASQALTNAGLALLATELDPKLRKELRLPEGGVVLRVDPFYYANIKAEWEADRKKAAFDLLEKLQAGSLIKTEVSILFPRGEKPIADKVLKAIERALGKRAGDVPVEVRESVHFGTLTAWLREQTEKSQRNESEPLSTDELETLGATVGRVAKLVPRK